MWHELINSNAFWSSFTKIYALHDELGTSEDAINAFRADAAQQLADFYAELSKKFDNNDYIAAFTKVFGVKGGQIQKDHLDPLYESINDASSKLSNLVIASDEAMTDSKLSAIKSLVRGLQKNFDKLQELGFRDDSSTTTMRDKAAMAIRHVYVDLYNNLNESSKSLSLLKVALEICGSPATASRLKQDMQDLKNKIVTEKVAKPINELIDAEKYLYALDLIATERPKYTSNQDLQNYFDNRTKLCVTAKAGVLLAEAKKLFNDGEHSQAKPKFDDIKDFILKYISYFNLSQKA